MAPTIMYKNVAKLLRNNKPHAKASVDAKVVWNKLLVDLAELFQKDNPKFDKARFLRACWPDPKSAPLTLDELRELADKESQA